MSEFASDEGWCTDDCRQQSSVQLEEQRNREDSNSISLGHDQGDSQFARRRVWSEDRDRALHLALDCSACRIPGRGSKSALEGQISESTGTCS